MNIIFLLEILGGIAFSVSGAFSAIRRRFDIFGIIVVAIVTMMGGGLLRDVVLGNTPPVMLLKPVYTLVSTFIAVVVILSMYLKRYHTDIRLVSSIKNVILIFDAIGLGTYTAVGASVAANLKLDNMFFVVFALYKFLGMCVQYLSRYLECTGAWKEVLTYPETCFKHKVVQNTVFY